MANSGEEQDKDGHFTGLGECKIHTSPAGTCDQYGACDYQANCDKPHVRWVTTATPWETPEGEREWEAHHILCVEAVTRYRLMAAYNADEKDNIDAVYRKTEWCINQGPNLIPLPRKRVYDEYAESRGLNWPCHCWDHNVIDGYLDEVRQELHGRIWQKLKEATAEDVRCKLAKEVVKVELERLAEAFKSVLRRRGRREVGSRRGTQAAWDESQKEEDADRAPKWWYPFSMAKDAVAADRPAKAFGKPRWSAIARRKARKAKNVFRV